NRLEPGAEWVVSLRLMGMRFNSRSTVLELDRGRRRFMHRSRREHSPSSTVWTWTVRPEGTGAVVTLAWELQPVTRLHTWVIAPVRSRQIGAQDVTASLAALGRMVRERSLS
ncbi:MAG TPA: hypothetical protein VF734_09115, partial [Pseudonocardiaceae bacterium]